MVPGEVRMTRPDAATEALAVLEEVVRIMRKGAPPDASDADNAIVMRQLLLVRGYVIRKARKSG